MMEEYFRGNLNNTTLVVDEYLAHLERKGKAFDEIEKAYWKSNSPENFAYEFVGIFEKHFGNDTEDTK